MGVYARFVRIHLAWLQALGGITSQLKRQVAKPAINAKRRKGDITARYAKYALYRLYRISNQIKPDDKTAHAKWAYFVAVLYTNYIRTIYLERKNALSGEAAVYLVVIPVKKNRWRHQLTALVLEITW